MQLHNKSTEQLSSDILQLQKTLAFQNLPNDEREMHETLLKKLQLEVGRRMNATASIQPPKAQPPVSQHNSSPSGVGGRPSETRQQPQSRTILAGGHAKTAQPITASIQLDNKSDQYNPTITITWSDGYQITVDETAATGRFKSTLRDTLALKCVDEARFDKMWRWDTPWRAAGFYQALTKFWNRPPSLYDLGYTRPTDRQREVFALITEKTDYAATI